MKLKKMVQDLDLQEIKGSKEVDITGISSDSRTVAPGNLFIAKKGGQFDGNAFIAQAVDSGASAVLADIYNPFLKEITQLIHPRPAEIEGELADRFFHHPSRELFVFGVTGTKGKTTTTYLVKHLLDAIGRPCGLVGSIEMILGRKRAYSSFTTHDVVTNLKLMREMIEEGCQAVSLEISSHGLTQGRSENIEFDVALFTNLTPDHLDYHSSMDDYAKAKRHLFELLDASGKKNKCAIVNASDPWTAQILKDIKTPLLTFGLTSEADIFADEISISADGTTFRVHHGGISQLFRTALIGRFNVMNLLGAIAVGVHLDIPLDKMSAIFSSFRTAPGRLERVENDAGIHVFVDHAHMGDALENVLKTLREIAKQQIIVVFGAGGNRDPGRRPGLARAAQKYADLSIITSDNPRSEDPEAICRQILQAFDTPAPVRVEIDRRRAIELALDLAKPDDIVLIAGKGHERMQIFSHQTIPFDDREVAKNKLESIAKAGHL